MLCGFLILGCQDPVEKEKSKYRDKMEDFIDSMEDDFGSYEFIEMGFDTLYNSMFYESQIDSNYLIYDNRGLIYKYRKIYRDEYENCNYRISKEGCKRIYGEVLDKYNREFEYDSIYVDNIRKGVIEDSILGVFVYLNYKIKNKNGGVEKKNCSINLNDYNDGEFNKKKGLRRLDDGFYKSWWNE